jgi:hypothetical protein
MNSEAVRFTLRMNVILGLKRQCVFSAILSRERGIPIYAPLRPVAAAPYSHTPPTEALAALRSTRGRN